MVQNQIHIIQKQIEISIVYLEKLAPGGVSYLPSWAKLLRETLDNWLWCLPFWSVEILVANNVESMKWSDSKQLATYTLARSITLAPSFPLLNGFAVQSLLT